MLFLDKTDSASLGSVTTSFSKWKLCTMYLSTSVLLLFSALVQSQTFRNNEAIIRYENASTFTYWYQSAAAVSMYTVPIDPVTGYAIADFGSTGLPVRGIMATNIKVEHPLGYLVGESSNMYIRYPGNFNLDSHYPARVLAYPANVRQRITVDNANQTAPANLVLVQDDDFGNSFASAYPLQIGTGTGEFVEVMGRVDYSNDIDYFVVSIRDSNPAATHSVNLWIEPPTGAITYVDTFCNFYDSAGVALASNDDARNSYAGCRIALTIKANTNYYMAVAAYTAGVTGRYVLRYSKVVYTRTTSLTRGTTWTTSAATTTLPGGNVTTTLRGTPIVFPTTYDAITFQCDGGCPVLTGSRIIEQTCLPHVLCTNQRPNYLTDCVESCAPLTNGPPTTSRRVPATTPKTTTTRAAVNTTRTSTTAVRTTSVYIAPRTTAKADEQNNAPSLALDSTLATIIGVLGAFVGLVVIWAVFCLRPSKPKLAQVSEQQAQYVGEQISQTMMAGAGGMPGAGMPLNMSVMGAMPMNMSVMGAYNPAMMNMSYYNPYAMAAPQGFAMPPQADPQAAPANPGTSAEGNPEGEKPATGNE